MAIPSPKTPVAEPAFVVRRAFVWRRVALLAWIVVLCLLPDPRPLGAPQYMVSLLCTSTGIGEPGGRVLATIAMRGGGIALLGALAMLAFGGRGWDRRSAAVLGLAPCLAVGALWVNYGYFPIAVQVQIAVISAVLGALLVMALRPQLAAAAVGVLAIVGLLGWGTATGISDDLDTRARAVGRHVLAAAGEVPDGDAGFARLLEIAFAFAADNSHGTDPAPANRAAILALAVILGEEQIARVAGRHIDLGLLPQVEALRARVTLQGRKDWPRHFWVSAGLTVLADADRSITVGLTKELMDATAGGTGFSFADLAADAAGNRCALVATRDAASARALQARIRAGVRVDEFCPELRDLPEGISRDAFQTDYGGLGGERSQGLVDEIQRRLEACRALR
ncbi:MAG TPA: hypothetical protein VFZ65_15890 [Planctomycetota bacterium]|nr:hypothetical protein [Planctomycetota bacterium]